MEKQDERRSVSLGFRLVWCGFVGSRSLDELWSKTSNYSKDSRNYLCASADLLCAPDITLYLSVYLSVCQSNCVSNCLAISGHLSSVRWRVVLYGSAWHQVAGLRQPNVIVSATQRRGGKPPKRWGWAYEGRKRDTGANVSISGKITIRDCFRMKPRPEPIFEQWPLISCSGTQLIQMS